MKLAIILYQHLDNPEGIPASWPAQVRQLADNEALEANEIEFANDKALEDYLALHRAEYDIWKSLQIESEPVPDTVLAHQLRTWLILNNIQLSSIDTAISGMPEDTSQQIIAKQIAQTSWEYAPSIRRDHPLVANFAIILGMSTEQIDQAFREAAKL